MPNQNKALTKNLIILHLTVFVWGFTGILGALISLPATQLVWYRVLIASLTLLIYLKAARVSLNVSKEVFLKLFFTGAIVALHWILFFQSIKTSTVSVTLVCLSSLTLFTAVLEPVLKNKKISRLEIITGLIIIAGIYMIFKFESRYAEGIMYGLLSALCASLFSIINSKQIKNRPAPVISFYELVGAWTWISIYLIISGGYMTSMSLGFSNLAYLIVLGTVCTSLAYVAGVAVMKELSAFQVALITNLEPVYGIILAFIFFGKSEQMTPGFYAGAIVIMAAIFIYPTVNKRRKKF